MEKGDEAAGWAQQPHRTVWSGCVSDSNSAAGSSGGQHGQPSDEHQDRSQPSEGNEEPAGLSAGFGRRWGGHLGGCPARDGVLPEQLPEGGVRGGLLLWCGLVVAPGLSNLAFAGRPPGVLALLVVGLGLGDGGQAGQVHGRQRGPEDECACEFGHGCLLNWSTGAGGRVLTDDDGIVWTGAPRRSSWHRWSPCRCGCSTPDARGKGASPS